MVPSLKSTLSAWSLSTIWMKSLYLISWLVERLEALFL